MIFLNYPNNPTAATATPEFFAKVVAFANKHNIMVCHDYAYSEMAYDGYQPPSFLATPGAMEVGIEFHSLSKTYNMTGWRIGWAAGNREIIAGLGQIKSNIDSGIFEAIQIAGIEAMRDDDAWLAKMRAIYTERRDVVVAGLAKLGLKTISPKATFYVWVEVPKGYDSAGFVAHLLEKCGICTTPGNGFGGPGEGYFRMALDRRQGAVAGGVGSHRQDRLLMGRAYIGLGSNLGDGRRQSSGGLASAGRDGGSGSPGPVLPISDQAAGQAGVAGQRAHGWRGNVHQCRRERGEPFVAGRAAGGHAGDRERHGPRPGELGGSHR